jgi:hypothetical protein
MNDSVVRLDITMVSTKIRVFWNTAVCSLVELTLKTEAAGYSEMLMLIYHTTVRHIWEECHLDINAIHASRFRIVTKLALFHFDLQSD